jgi:hypothetical protein
MAIVSTATEITGEAAAIIWCTMATNSAATIQKATINTILVAALYFRCAE